MSLKMAPSIERSLILFDIDGTLVDVHGAGKRAFALAITQTWNIVDDLADITFAGATDRGVLRQLRARHALHEADEHRFFQTMEHTLLVSMQEQMPILYEGVRTGVTAWQQRPGAVLGLVTGNGRRCAHLKLEQAGLDPGIFDVGGYGDEHHDRNALAQLALERAEAGHGGAFDVVYLVGDTPNDIVAAHAIEAIAVGVTTGGFDRRALVQAGAHIVVDSLAALKPTTILER